MGRRPHPAVILVLAPLLLLAGAGVLRAAGGGTVAGSVVDSGGPVPGAIAQLTGGALKAPLGAVTDAKGIYHFDGVAPGTYVVTVTFAGGRPIKSSPIRVAGEGLTRVPPISLIVETVKVQAETEKLVEVTTTAVGESFKSDQLQEVPTGRSYTDVVQLAPGVSKSDGTGGVAAYGSTGLESTYRIDGIDVTSIGSGSAGTPIHFDIVKEIQVKTGGYEAEYGGAQGAFVNVLTKEGGNEFEGSLSLYATPDSLTSQAQTNGFGTALPTPDGQEVAASLGGYFVKDKVFFYTGYSRQAETRTAEQRFGSLFARTEAQSTDGRDLYFFKTTWQMGPGRRLVASFLADPRLQNRRDELGGPGGDHRVKEGGLDGTLLYSSLLRDGRFLVEGQVGIHEEGQDVDPTEQQEELNPIGATRRDSHPSVRARCKDINDPYCLGTASGLSTASTLGEPSLRFGPYPYSGRTDGTRRFANVSTEAFLKGHSVKFGVGDEKADFNQDLEYGYGTGMSLEWLPVSSPLGDPTRPPVSILGVRRCWGDGHGNCRQWDDQVKAQGATDTGHLFAQDSWTIGPKVTLNYGIRWESQEVLDGQGRSLVRMSKDFAPRLGAIWDVLGDARSKLYASWGRYFDSVPMQVVSRAFSPRITSTRMYRAENWSRQGFLHDIDPSQNGICATNTPLDDQGTTQKPTCWDFESADLMTDPNASAFSLVDKVHTSQGVDLSGSGGLYPDTIVDSGSRFRAPIDPDIKGAHTDELILGSDWLVHQKWKVGVKTIRRDLKEAIEDISLDYGKNFIIANPGGPYRFFVDPANGDMVNPNYVPGSTDPAQQPGFAQIAGCTPGAVCELTNGDLERLGYGGFPRATRRFRGYELDVAGDVKGRLRLNLSYLRSSTVGNYRGRYFVESEERDPNLTEAFDVPALVVNSDGPLPQDQRNQLKLFGNYQVTPNFTVGTNLSYVSGAPYSATTDPTGGSTPFFGPLFLLRRGAAGRLPSSQRVDLSFTYHIRDQGKLMMSLSLDMFNVLNSQKPVAVDEQFLATGLWSGVYPDGYGGIVFSPELGSRTGRGEPLVEYVDTTFGNGDGVLDRREWNAWAQSFQGRFRTLDELYAFLRTEQVTLTKFGETFSAPAYPGFAGCPESLNAALASGCAGINPGFGRGRLLEPPRSIRLGIRLSF